MTLPPGTRLGPYEILALIGAGGMGEVYKARDSRLDRVVAIKLLQADQAGRTDRQQRFATEARAISSLSHPHICALFDVGEAEGRSFLVMEYLEGQTLDDRLASGPLPAAEVLRFGAQIADALDHAHRAHLVHRDLKPSNVLLTRSGPKLLDFGLAKFSASGRTEGATTASFDERKLTAEGTVLGTLQYMSPEQLEGRTVDARTDIFAFGVLLYEVATGRRAFDGPTQTSLIAAILTHQPASSSIARAATNADALPAAFDHVVARCLAKSPDERWQTAYDLKSELGWIREGGAAPSVAITPSGHRTALGWLAAAAIVATVLAASWLVRDRRPPPTEITRFVVPLPAGTTVGSARAVTLVAASPDGRKLAFVGTTGGRERLWVHSFDAVSPRVLEGTDGAQSPFWSPDSRFIGYFSPGEGAIKKVEASGGPPRSICAATMFGLPVWTRDNTILFSEFRKGISRVSADGGTPMPATRVERSDRELNHFWPSVLPDGRHILYTATRLDADGHRATPIVYAASLDSSERKEIARVHSRMVYVSPGYVLYVNEAALLAQAFDTDHLQLTGEPIRIADSVDYHRSTANAGFSVSDAGVLVYHGGAGPQELTWFDRSGRKLGAIGARQQFGSARISRDGERVAVDILEPRLGTSDIWVFDRSRGAGTRFTNDLNDETFPLWSPDDTRMMFGSDRGTGKDASSDFFVKNANGLGDEELIFDQLGPQFLEDWSSDGRWVAYLEDSTQTRTDVWMLPLGGDRKPWPFARTRFEEWGARFSPDAASVAFVSDESGTFEVYVGPLQGSGPKTAVSTGGGISPRWRRDGKELFYLSSDGRTVMAVPMQQKPTLKAGIPAPLFTLQTETSHPRRARNAAFDVTPDGQRFLLTVPVSEPASSRITVVLNWMAALTP